MCTPGVSSGPAQCPGLPTHLLPAGPQVLAWLQRVRAFPPWKELCFPLWGRALLPSLFYGNYVIFSAKKKRNQQHQKYKE